MAVEFDAAGAASSSIGGTFSFKHTAAAGAYVFLAFARDRNGGNVTAKYDDDDMTLLADGTASAATTGLMLFGIADVDGGEQTVAVTSQISGAWFVANTVSYTGISEIGVPVLTSGTSTAPSTGEIPCDPGDMVIAFLANCATITTAAISAPAGGTNRYLKNAGGGTVGLVISDSDETETFGATLSASAFWDGIAVVVSGVGDIVAEPESARLSITGHVPQIHGVPIVVQPASAALSLSGGTPSVDDGSTGVEYSATGTGYTGIALNAGSWSHTATAGDTVLVFVQNDRAGDLNGVTYDDVSMDLVGVVAANNDASNGRLWLYRLDDAPGGTKTVAVTFAAGVYCSAQSVSYANVGAVGAPIAGYGTGTALSQPSVAVKAKQIAVQSFGASSKNGGGVNSTAVLSSFSGGTHRWDSGTGRPGLAVSDSDTSTGFAATSSIDQPYAYMAVVLAVGAATGPTDTLISPDGASLHLNGDTPRVIIGNAVTIRPASAELTLTGVTARVLIAVVNTVTPNAAQLTLATNVPRITGVATIITPQSAVLTLTGIVARVGANFPQSPFDRVLAHLETDQTFTWQVVGDSTSWGWDDIYQGTLFGWAGRMTRSLAQYYDFNATVKETMAQAYTEPATVWTSERDDAPSADLTLAAIIGKTVEDWAGRALANVFPNTNPDVILISLGFNETDIDSFISTYRAYVDSILDYCPGVPIIVTTQNNTTTTELHDIEFTDLFNALIDAFIPGESMPLTPVMQSSTIPGVWVLDSQQMGLVGAELADGLHPSAAGYEAYGKWMQQQLAPNTVFAPRPRSAALGIEGGTPVVGTVCRPHPAILTITGRAAGVATTAHVRVEPESAALHLTAAAPHLMVTRPVIVRPAAARLEIQTSAPTITGRTLRILAQALALTITPGHPGMSGVATLVRPTQATLTTRLATPQVIITKAFAPTPLSRIITVPMRNRTIIVPAQRNTRSR